MAKAYEAPSKRKDEDDDDDVKTRQQTQNNPQQTNQTTQTPPQSATDQVNKEAQQQSEAAAKERSAYINEMNRRIEEVVNFASQHKDKNPQLLNLTSEALKNAACQIDAATPQGSSHRDTAPKDNPQPSMR